MIQVYTGSGKGKTTAALGLALRASGAGLQVYIMQFLKKGRYSEVKALKGIRNIRFCQSGCRCFLKGRPLAKDLAAARRGLAKARNAIAGSRYDVVILDELNVALDLGLLECEEVLAILKNNPPGKEIIITGRHLDPRIRKIAHLVSEIREIKHYFKDGMKGRKGIEY